MEKGVEVTPSMQVIIAAWNEEEGVGLTIQEFTQLFRAVKVLVVDGRSNDRTVEVAKNCGAEIVFQDGKGKGDALAKAVQLANLDVDYVVITDADFTYPAEFVPGMIRILDDNPSVGMVCGNRFTEDLEKEALHDLFYFGNRLIAFTHNLFNGVHLTDPLTGLRVVRTGILRDWAVKSKGFDIEVELNSLVERKGFDIVEVPIQYRKRLGEKKLKISHGASIFKRILMESTY